MDLILFIDEKKNSLKTYNSIKELLAYLLGLFVSRMHSRVDLIKINGCIMRSPDNLHMKVSPKE